MFTQILDKLSSKESNECMFNPYQNKKILNNLKLYFDYIYKNNSGIFLVGEAPGYKGCKITGIPFTSSDILNSDIKIFNNLKNKIYIEKIEKENTATIIWDYLKNKNKIPLFWNSFPYHPFNKDKPNSNRTPTSEEIEENKYFIEELVKIFKPEIIASIGRKGEKILNNIYPNNEIKYIRHPSYGGKEDFIKGMNDIYNRRQL